MVELIVAARSPGPRSKIMVVDSIFGKAAALTEKVNPRPSIASQDQPCLSYRKRRGGGAFNPTEEGICNPVWHESPAESAATGRPQPCLRETCRDRSRDPAQTEILSCEIVRDTSRSRNDLSRSSLSVSASLVERHHDGRPDMIVRANGADDNGFLHRVAP